jgi:hypothetical protein
MLVIPCIVTGYTLQSKTLKNGAGGKRIVESRASAAYM